MPGLALGTRRVLLWSTPLSHLSSCKMVSFDVTKMSLSFRLHNKYVSKNVSIIKQGNREVLLQNLHWKSVQIAQSHKWFAGASILTRSWCWRLKVDWKDEVTRGTKYFEENSNFWRWYRASECSPPYEIRQNKLKGVKLIHFQDFYMICSAKSGFEQQKSASRVQLWC